MVDCSDRLIRRAEASFPVRYNTLERIAIALSGFGQQVLPGDLVSSHQAIAKRLWKSYAKHGPNLPDYFPHFSVDICWSVFGPANTIPFAGEWNGLKELRRCLQRFDETIERQSVAASNTIVLEADQHVVIKYTELWRRVGNAELNEEVWGNLHISFCDGMVYRVEHQFDTLAAYRLFAKLRSGIEVE